ncbi:tripartite tricarboxylate transporter substrate binding protein [Variovorax robiniae]|uniref:Tripartite tricarboxylate transporter substrate binding protein n=1 Tax=Variovorax robiniae TaxID=1836199 RepID=A0ABU8XAY4_9BURK
MNNTLSGINRRTVISGIALALASTHIGQGWAADAWPTKTVRIIVPFAPGGGADSSARVLAEVLAPKLGQSVIVENKPGAGSAIGVMAAAQSKDGHTLLMGSNSMVINPVLNPAIAYDVARDFDAVGMVSAQPLVLVVPASSKITSYAELVAEAKAKPGTVTAGNSGNGTLAHLTAELFAVETKTSITSVPYKGESALLPDLIGGLVSCGFLNLPSVITHIKSGRLRALAVSSPTPVVELPNVPTLRSLGQPSLEVQGWAALVAPKGTIPKDGLARLEALLAQALATDTVKTRFAAMSLQPVARSRDDTAQYLKAEAARWQQVIKARGIKADS